MTGATVLVFWGSRHHVHFAWLYVIKSCLSHYDLSVLSMSVIGFKKSWDMPL